MPTFPLVLFAFNRPDHVRRTLAALSDNSLADQTDLFVFCDGARSDEEQAMVEEVRRVCKAAKGFRSVQVSERETNLGLAASIRLGVTEVLEQSLSLIFLCDWRRYAVRR